MRTLTELFEQDFGEVAEIKPPLTKDKLIHIALGSGSKTYRDITLRRFGITEEDVEEYKNRNERS
jgi:hypothetical protein